MQKEFHQEYSITLFLTILLMCTSVFYQVGNTPTYLIILFLCIGVFLIKKNIIISNLNLFLFIWIVYSFIQVYVLDFDQYAVRYYVYLFSNILIFWVIINYCKTKKLIGCVNKAIILGLVVNLIIGYWEIITGNHIKVLDTNYLRRFENVPVTFYSNANDLATFLICAFFVLMLEMFMTKNKRYKLFLVFLIFLDGVLIYFTKSRAGIWGIILFVLCWLVFYPIIKKRSLPLFILLLLVLSAAFILLIFLDNQIFKNFFLEVGRQKIWAKALTNFWSAPFFGIGPGQSLYSSGNVHFVVLEILSEYGLLIFGGAVTIYFTMLINVFRKNIPFQFSVLFFGFLILFIPLSISSSSMTRIPIVWVVLGIVYSMQKNVSGENDDINDNRKLCI